MYLTHVIVIAMAHFGLTVQTAEVGREVPDGVEIINTGPIQLILPANLSSTIKNSAQCKGLFRICYISDPTATHDILFYKYHNVGSNCPPGPPGYCTLSLEPEHNSVYALGVERHHGNWYALFVDSSTLLCPRYIVDGVSNFTVIDVPNCPVTVDGARLPKLNDDQNVKIKNETDDKKWIIAVCIGLVLLLLIICIAVTWICMRPIKKSLPSEKPDEHVPQASKSQISPASH